MLVDVLRFVPKRALTGAFGALARRRVPRRLRPAVYGTFARWTGADPTEADRPLDGYETFQAFFQRGLRPGIRPVDDGPVVAPVDGTVVASGRIERGTLLQAKGRTYGVAELLADDAAAAPLADGTFATFYLAPRDYHRIHSPCDGRIVASRHVPGTLFSVNAASTASVDRLFARNERLITHLHTAGGPVAVVKVAALGVGTVRARYDEDAWRRTGAHAYDPPLAVARGEEIASFAMGSTVILLAAPGVTLLPMPAGRAVRMGEPLGTWRDAAEPAPAARARSESAGG